MFGKKENDMRERIKEWLGTQFPLVVLTLIPVGVAINLGIGMTLPPKTVPLVIRGSSC